MVKPGSRLFLANEFVHVEDIILILGEFLCVEHVEALSSTVIS